MLNSLNPLSPLNSLNILNTIKAICKASAAFIASNAAFTTQARRAARQLGVMRAHHAPLVELLYLAESE